MQPHFDEIFGLYQQGFDGIAKLLREKDDTHISKHSKSIIWITHSDEQAKRMQQLLVNSHTKFVHSIYKEPHLRGNLEHSLENDFYAVCNFVERTCSPKYNPSLEHLADCLSLVMDIVDLDKKKFKKIVKSQFNFDNLARTLEPYINELSRADSAVEYYCRIIHSYEPPCGYGD